jgi:hypothetical protein
LAYLLTFVKSVYQQSVINKTTTTIDGLETLRLIIVQGMWCFNKCTCNAILWYHWCVATQGKVCRPVCVCVCVWMCPFSCSLPSWVSRCLISPHRVNNGCVQKTTPIHRDSIFSYVKWPRRANTFQWHFWQGNWATDIMSHSVRCGLDFLYVLASEFFPFCLHQHHPPVLSASFCN